CFMAEDTRPRKPAAKKETKPETAPAAEAPRAAAEPKAAKAPKKSPGAAETAEAGKAAPPAAPAAAAATPVAPTAAELLAAGAAQRLPSAQETPRVNLENRKSQIVNSHGSLHRTPHPHQPPFRHTHLWTVEIPRAKKLRPGHARAEVPSQIHRLRPRPARKA